jgi:hypothetical protein
MEAKDLRIGNLIEWVDGKYRRVSMIDKYGNGVGALERVGLCSSDLWKPIPLTEEWLIKFGNWDLTEEGLLSYDLKWDEQLEEWLFYVYNIRGDKINCAMIKHVHQLQNLYYALTGEELEIY